MADDWWGESEMDISESREVAIPPDEFSETEKYRVPDRLSAGWIERQLPKSTWKGLGKNSRINQHVIFIMCEAARKGLSKRAIMAQVGLSGATWTSWESRAKDGDPVYLLWYQCMMHSISQVEGNLIESIQDASQKDWRAAKWLLERINAEEYSDGPGGGLTVNVNNNETKTTINTITDNDSLEIANLLHGLGIISGDNVLEGEVVEDEDGNTDA